MAAWVVEVLEGEWGLVARVALVLVVFVDMMAESMAGWLVSWEVDPP